MSQSNIQETVIANSDLSSGIKVHLSAGESEDFSNQKVWLHSNENDKTAIPSSTRLEGYEYVDERNWTTFHAVERKTANPEMHNHEVFLNIKTDLVIIERKVIQETIAVSAEGYQWTVEEKIIGLYRDGQWVGVRSY